MKKLMSAVLSIVAASLLLPPDASAQQIVKRVRCADLVLNPLDEQYVIYTNDTFATSSVTVQIVRDGCRPRGDDGALYLINRTTDGASTAYEYFHRNRKSTSMHHFLVQNGRVVAIGFDTADGKPRRGTMDYVITAE